MLKKIAAVAGGVFIGLVIAFARAGAFPFWGSGTDASKASQGWSATFKYRCPYQKLRKR